MNEHVCVNQSLDTLATLARSYIRPASDPHPSKPLISALLLGTIVWALYVVSAAPTISWGDSADLPLRIVGDPDRFAEYTAREYTLYREVGRIFATLPVGDVGYRVNLQSGMFSVFGVVAVYFMVLVRNGRRLAACVAALALACSHTWWWMSSVAEVYTFAGSIVLVAMLFWLQWEKWGGRGWLFVASMTSGLAASAHAAGVLFLFAVILYLVRLRDRLRTTDCLVAIVAMFAGAAYLFVLLMTIWWNKGVAEFSWAFITSNPHVPAHRLTALWHALALLLYQFPGPGMVLAVLGLAQVWSSAKPWDRLLLSTWVVTFGWALIDRIPDIFNSFAFSFAVLAPVIGVGCARALALFERRRAVTRAIALALLTAVTLAPIALYSATPWLVDRLGVDATGARHCPERNNNWYFLFPPKWHDYGARRYAEEALDAVAFQSVLIADYTLWRPLRFIQQVERRRPDVTLEFADSLVTQGQIPSFIEQTLSHRAVYLAAIDPPNYYGTDLIKRGFELRPRGPVFEVTAKR